MTLLKEIFEQPKRIHELLSGRQRVEELANVIRSQDPHYVFLAARGSSDNAGRYANYLWSAQNKLPMALATPSLFTYYNQPPSLHNALIVGISQSGRSPDIVSVLQEGQQQGCLTLAITNSPDSPLAQIANLVFDVQAGEEKSVAATKTYTAELTSLAMLSAALKNDETMWSDLQKLPDWAEEVISQSNRISQLSQRYRFLQQCVVLGRGYNYATAFEWALKLKELTYIIAEPYSSADFQHGPIAMIASGFPVMAVAVNGKVFNSMMEMLTVLKEKHKAELMIVSDNDQALGLAQSAIALPPEIPEWLTPIISIIPAQLFVYHLTQIKGYDTESPRSINKITETH